MWSKDLKSKFSVIKEINSALPGLLLGIILFGTICQVIIFLLAEDKAGYSIGLWMGIITAVFMAIHMALSLNVTVEMDEKGAQTAATRHNLIRYAIVVIIMGIIMVTEIGNPLTAFLGVMGLKASAYLQPLFKKLSRKNELNIEN